VSSSKRSIALLYWGRRGGGDLLARQLGEEAQSRNIETLLFLRPKKWGTSDSDVSIFNVLAWLSARREVIRGIEAAGVSSLIIPMASPWDIFLGRKLTRNGIEVIRIIHDASPHPGDFFPPKFWIRLLCNDASKIIALSAYVAHNLSKMYSLKSHQLSIATLPGLELTNENLQKSRGSRKKFLFIGRAGKYKGLQNLLHAWQNVGDSESILIVAGEGHKVPRSIKRVTHINRWLDEKELVALILEADVVVLPYIEASQSGIVAVALSLSRPVVVTPVGALAEQIKNGINGLVCKDTSPQSLSDALNSAISHPFRFEKESSKASSVGKLFNICIEKSN